MDINIRRFFLLTVGLLFCMLGCTRDRGHILMPDHIEPPTEVMESTDIEASFEQNILPILTARCALAGCHVADGPHGLDYRTYESFTAGGEHGSVFIPGNAAESEIIEEIVEGKMPPKGPPLTDAEIQLFIDWINQQETQVDVIAHEHSDEHAVERGIHDDMDDEHEEDDDHDDMDAEHEEDDDHDDDDIHDDMDDEHEGEDKHDDMDDEHEEDHDHDDDA